MERASEFLPLPRKLNNKFLIYILFYKIILKNNITKLNYVKMYSRWRMFYSVYCVIMSIIGNYAFRALLFAVYKYKNGFTHFNIFIRVLESYKWLSHIELWITVSKILVRPLYVRENREMCWLKEFSDEANKGKLLTLYFITICKTKCRISTENLYPNLFNIYEFCTVTILSFLFVYWFIWPHYTLCISILIKLWYNAKFEYF